jgi:protein-S-isoprenylcysteine O-methyltransferase Ste14
MMANGQLHQTLVMVYLAFAALAFVALFFVAAPYGRHRNIRFGPEINPRLGWVAMEAPAGIFHNLQSGGLNGWNVGGLGGYTDGWFSDPRFFIGVLIFAVGFFIHATSDDRLRNLRTVQPGGYEIPRGGFFKWVSCPNYFGEMIQWLGWAICTWSLAGMAFFLFTVANLLPRALSHHRWYREQFSKYPKNRKAVIPGIL